MHSKPKTKPQSPRIRSSRQKPPIGKLGGEIRKPKAKEFPLTKRELNLITYAAWEWAGKAMKYSGSYEEETKLLLLAIRRLDDWNLSRKVKVEIRE